MLWGGLLSGALLAAATPPAPSPVPPFVALVPLALVLVGLEGPRAGRRAGRRAWTAGATAVAVQHAWGLRWLPGTLAAVAGGPVGGAAALLVLAVLAAWGGAAAWAVHRLLHGPWRLPLVVALPLAWTALEGSLARLPLGLAFPWAPLGLGLARWPEALGVAEEVGIAGVTAWLTLVNAAAAAALRTAGAGCGGTRWRTLGWLGFALAAALVPVAWGAARMRDLPVEPVGRVAALSFEAPPGEAPAAAADRALAALERRPSEGPLPDLVVLPEMALPMDLDAPEAASAVAAVRAHAAARGTPVLVGVRTTRAGAPRNAAVLLGGPPFEAHKRRLVPGAERGAGVAPAWLASGSGYAPGEGWPVLARGDFRAGVLVCYEGAFGDDTRRLVAGGARVLLVLSSDAWFGGGGGARGAGVEQQIAHLVARAIETRTAVVRSASGGPAAAVEPTGRVRTLDRGELVAVVSSGRVPTGFARRGDLLGPAALMVLALLLGAPAVTARVRPRRSSVGG